MKQFTLYEHKEKVFESHYGLIDYDTWCRREAQRINTDGGKAAYKENPTNPNECAIFLSSDPRLYEKI